VAESGWRFGAAGSASPVQFEIPNQHRRNRGDYWTRGERDDEESPAELATVTRWVIGGAGGGGPERPMFLPRRPSAWG